MDTGSASGVKLKYFTVQGFSLGSSTVDELDDSQSILDVLRVSGFPVPAAAEASQPETNIGEGDDAQLAPKLAADAPAAHAAAAATIAPAQLQHAAEATNDAPEAQKTADPEEQFIKITLESSVVPLPAPAAAAATVGMTEQELADLGRRPFWTAANAPISSPLLRLHNEIVQLCRLLQPTKQEEDAREGDLADVTAVINSLWPHATVKLFGSYSTGLYVPTSDVDLVVLNARCSSNIPGALRTLANALTKAGIAHNLQVRPTWGTTTHRWMASSSSSLSLRPP